MELATALGILMASAWLVMTAALLYTHFEYKEPKLWIGSPWDLTMVIVGVPISAFFIVTGTNLALIASWVGLIIFEVTGAILYTLSEK